MSGETVVTVARAALLDIGRDDLADAIVWFEEDGGYIEVLDDVTFADMRLIVRAEELGRQAATA